MREILLFVLISIVYLLSLWRIYVYFQKREIKYLNATGSTLTEINNKIDVIAVPRNYIINIVQDEKEIETSQFADLVVNISDYIRSKSEQEYPDEEKLEKVFLKDIDFSQYKIIK